MKKRIIALFGVISAIYTFSSFEKVYQGYTSQELRDLYGSGNPDLWPKPHLFDEAKDGFKDIGSMSKPEFPKDNPYSKDKEELGKILFFDPRLSASGQISCANCHDPELAWADGRRVAYGHDRQQGTRNTPTILNIIYAKEYFWDGRAATLEQQAKAPIENPVEMNLHSRLAVISPKSKFDKFIGGEKDILTDSEINGLHLFRTKANCINCHNTPYFSDQKFHNIGLTYFGREYEDLGLYNISKKNEDVGKFKTPTLREVSQTSPYMHNGLFPNIRGVLNMYNAGMPNEKRNRDSPLAPKKSAMLEKLNLTDTELTDLENFLKTLHSYQYKMRAPQLPK